MPKGWRKWALGTTFALAASSYAACGGDEPPAGAGPSDASDLDGSTEGDADLPDASGDAEAFPAATFCMTLPDALVGLGKRCGRLAPSEEASVSGVAAAECKRQMDLAGQNTKKYQGDVAQRCLEALANVPCDAPRAAEAFCETVFAPNLGGTNPGDPCILPVLLTSFEQRDCGDAGLRCLPGGGTSCSSCQVPTPSPIGGDCMYQPCVAGAYCQQYSPGTRATCRAYPDAGTSASCVNNDGCNPATEYCRLTFGRGSCARFAQVGASCAPPFFGDPPKRCVANAACVGTPQVCVEMKKLGEACGTDAPCREGACPVLSGGAAVCTPRRNAGEACGSADECTSGTCVCQGDGCPSRVCGPVPAGATCVTSKDCETSAFCRAPDGGAGVCEARAGVGGPCFDGEPLQNGCAAGLVCRGTGGARQCALPTSGTGTLGDTCLALVDCATGLYCALDRFTKLGQCKARLAAGEVCAAEDAKGRGQCAAGLGCAREGSSNLARCSPSTDRGFGESCDGYECNPTSGACGAQRCKDGLKCTFSSTYEDGGFVARGTCERVVPVGAACGQGTVCVAGLAKCESSTCVPLLPEGAICAKRADCISSRCIAPVPDGGTVCGQTCQ